MSVAWQGDEVGNVDPAAPAPAVTGGKPVNAFGVAYLQPPVEADPLWYPATVVPARLPQAKRRRGLRALLRGWRP